MWRLCASREHVFTGVMSVQVVLILALLNMYRYCKFEVLENVHFGLRGGELDSNITTYQDIMTYCKQKLTEPDLCQDIEFFENAGAILWSILLLDIIIVSSWVLISLLMITLIKRLIKISQNTNKIPVKLLNLVRLLQHAKLVILAHPVLLIIGLIAWCVVSKVDSISRDTSIEIEEGLILLLILVFISMLTTALYLLHIINTRRNNLRENSRQTSGLDLTYYEKYECITPSSKKLDASDTFSTPSSSLKL